MSLDDLSPEVVNAELVEPISVRARGDEPFGVPRRFGIGTIMVITAAYSLLLSLLRVAGAPPGVVWFLIVFVSLIGLGQMLMFGAAQPRKASIIMGALALPVMTVATIALFRPRGTRVEEMVCAMLAAFIFGGGFGYLAGGVVAGVFLVMDGVEQALAGRKTHSPDTG